MVFRFLAVGIILNPGRWHRVAIRLNRLELNQAIDCENSTAIWIVDEWAIVRLRSTGTQSFKGCFRNLTG